MYYDWTYILVLIGAVLCMAAQSNVTGTYSKYSRVRSRVGLTGAQIAEKILHENGIYDVSVEHVSGSLTDHYDPAAHVLRLSDVVYGSTSIAAAGVAAHECGHAIQHQNGYLPLKMRNLVLPVASIGSKLCWPILILGMFVSYTLVDVGILLFAAIVVFQIITLPVEFDASARGLRILENSGFLYDEELGEARKVLTAAALTYVASVASSLLQLLRIMLIFGRRDRR